MGGRGGDYVTTGAFYVAVLKFRPLADTSSLWNECKQLPAVSVRPSVRDSSIYKIWYRRILRKSVAGRGGGGGFLFLSADGLNDRSRESGALLCANFERNFVLA